MLSDPNFDNLDSILHVNRSNAYGGLEIYTLLLIKKILEKKGKTALYCMPGSKLEAEAKKLGIPIYHAIKKAKISPLDIIRIRKIINKNNFKIIHTHTSHDVWLCSLTLYFCKDTTQIFSLYMNSINKNNIFHRFIYKNVKSIVTSSNILNQQVKLHYPVFPNQVQLLRYGRDLEKYQKNNAIRKKIREFYNVHDDEIVVATICRIDPQKGVKEFAESLLHFDAETKKKIKLWIVGEPTLKHLTKDQRPIYEPQSLQLFEWLNNFKLSPEINERIQLIPFQNDIISFLNAVDVFVLGTYKETYSLSVLDAMAMGLPVIGTNSGGTPEQILHNERGLLVQPKSSLEISKAISFYLNNPEHIARHGENAKKWIQKEHSWQQKLENLYCLYSQFNGK
ncbi:MAG: glycosyltransferase family 1 protein [Spirobacillus cienkowskii]|uniref:Glycosyltransferase family 1 protein n=1 Tax=Spirobacillus cienkowskii TaxID=495820 RepID=A0A369KT56_9BACT|nr:MAG: glycosyltransferase family 1 protein [Spirobacillus cienkowskii]